MDIETAKDFIENLENILIFLHECIEELTKAISEIPLLNMNEIDILKKLTKARGSIGIFAIITLILYYIDKAIDIKEKLQNSKIINYFQKRIYIKALTKRNKSNK